MMTDVSTSLWNQYASLIASVTTGGKTDQILPMLVATPVEADWFAQDVAALAPPPEPSAADMSTPELRDAVDRVVQDSGHDDRVTSLAAGTPSFADPDDLESMVTGSAPDPGPSLEKATLDEDGQPEGRGDAGFAPDAQKKAKISGLSPAQERFLNTVAFLPGQYGPLWGPGSVRAADAYKSILLNISIGDMTEDAHARVEQAYKAYSTSFGDYYDIQTKAVQAYNDYVASMRQAGADPDSLRDYLDRSGYTNRLSAALTERNADYARFRQVVQDSGLREDLIEAVAALRPDVPQLFVMSEVTDAPSSWNNTFSQETSHTEQHEDLSKTGWGLSASGMYDFVTFGGSASGSSEHQTISTSEVDMKIEFEGWRQVTIIPGVSDAQRWNNNAIISKYVGHLQDNSKNDWAETSVFHGSSPGRQPYGKTGFLPFWPVGAIVVYKPTVTLTMATSQYEKNASSWSAEVDIGIGPFTFGPKASHSHVQVDQEGDKTSIVMTDNSEVPKLLALQMQVMPPGGAA